MANEIQYSNFSVLANTISARISPAFVTQAVMLSLVYTEVFSPNSKVRSFRKAGSVTAQTLAESTNYTVDGNSELTDSKVDATAEKKVISTAHSVESLRFATSAAQAGRFAQEHATALARLFDADTKTLFSSVSATAGTSGAVLSKDGVLDARYTVVSGTKGAGSGRLAGVIDYKGANELSKELTDTGAVAFNSMGLGAVGIPQANGYTGSLLGIEFYQTDGLPTSGSDDVGCVFDVNLAFAAAVDGNGGFRTEIHRPEMRTGGHLILDTYTFWKVVEYNDAAACQLISAT